MRIVQRDIAGMFIFSSDNFLLLGKSRDGGVYKDTWIVPGGGVEPGETFLQAAIRETQEEVGIDVTDFRIASVDEVFTGESKKTLRDTGEDVLVQMNFHNFTAHSDLPAADIHYTCGDDIVTAKWHNVADLKNTSITVPMRQLLKKLGYLQ